MATNLGETVVILIFRVIMLYYLKCLLCNRKFKTPKEQESMAHIQEEKQSVEAVPEESQLLDLPRQRRYIGCYQS